MVPWTGSGSRARPPLIFLRSYCKCPSSQNTVGLSANSRTCGLTSIEAGAEVVVQDADVLGDVERNSWICRGITVGGGHESAVCVIVVAAGSDPMR